MKKKINSFFSIILPNKKVNIFAILIILLGIISGSIFLIILSKSDKELVMNKITSFMININENKINNLEAFKNAMIENSIFIIIMWVLGASIIGIIINVFLTYIKGFIVGFSVSSFILTFNYKGIISSLIYVFPTTIINLLITILISVYSFSFTIILYKSIFNKTNNFMIKGYIKKYIYILLISIGLSFISSLSEAFLLPSMMKLVIKLFI